MNRNQQYPERMEDYQVELMSTSALVSEANSEEVEREIQRLTEGGNGVVGEEQTPAPRAPREQRERGGDRQRKGDRNDRDRQQKPRNNNAGHKNNDGGNRQQNKPRREGGDRDRRSGGRERRG